MKKFIIFILLASVPMLQGCAIGILAAGVGYAVSAGRKGTAAQMEAKGRYLSRYETYKLGMEEINLEREKAELVPKSIKEFDVWLDEQPLTPEEAKLFEKRQGQTPKELKAIQAEKEKAEKAAQEEKDNTPPPTQNFGSK